MDILTKIKKVGLVGRGGACFPTGQKWDMVKKAEGKVKYVVCNASEGEPGVKKDFFILHNFGERVIDGIKIAVDFFQAEPGIIYINYKYNKKLGKKLAAIIGDKPIEFFIKPINSGYIGGEESSILNAIEGKLVEPRLRPPFPTTFGLYGCPTLINNVETLYNVSLVADGKFKNKRFYTLGGDCMHEGVYELGTSYTIEKILKETGNWPKFPFFVQVGGDASGEVLSSNQLRRVVSGSGSITVCSLARHKSKDLIKKWLNFYLEESCGQCVPCREGVYRLVELINSPNIDWALFSDLLDNLAETSFCGLGCAVSIQIKSYIKNVLADLPDNEIKINGLDNKRICECFK